jgi:hypothetical protein
MWISRNYKADDWKALTFKTEDDWQKAIATLSRAFETSQ